MALRITLFSLHVSIFLFGLVGLIGKFLTISPTAIVFGRAAFASGVLLLYLIVKNQS
jgi:hypothetical protein